jgi:putative glycosyltransferase (TIGR04372 family)
MIFRKLRRFLKPKLKRYPAAFRLYQATSWLFTRSPLALAVKSFVASGIDLAFPMWITPRFRLAYRYAVAGNVQKAIAIADDVLARRPELSFSDDAFHRLVSIYYLQGRYEDANRLFQHIEERRYQAALQFQYDRLDLRFFSKDDFSAIGHLGILDKYMKGEILGMIPRRTNVLLGATRDFSNPAYLEYWQKYFSLITDPRTISFLSPLSSALREQFSVIRVGERARSVVAFGAEVQLRWEAEGRGPLLELTAEHRRQGYQVLRELGVSEGAWFVGLHVREGSDRMRDVRNSDVTTYHLAIEEIARRGGWVLRMGDPKMRPLPPYPNAIDYAHCAKREDWMDVFLWAEGRFFIGTGSGPQVIPTTFGRPVAITNYGPVPTIVCGKDDILLPKRYWLEREARQLTLDERMSPTYGFRESIDAFAAIGVRVVDNTPEEICEVVIEMMDRLEGRLSESEHEREVQACFAEIAATYDVYPVKLARTFVSKCPDLFQRHGAGGQGAKKQ